MDRKSELTFSAQLVGAVCAILLVIGGLALSGCSESPVTGDKFTSTVESFGYKTVDATDSVKQDSTFENPEYVELAIVSQKGATGIVFYEFSDDAQARIFYGKEDWKYDSLLKNTMVMPDGPEENVEVDSGSIAYHKLRYYDPNAKKNRFTKVSLRGNIVITAFADNGSEETERVLTRLGY